MKSTDKKFKKFIEDQEANKIESDRQIAKLKAQLREEKNNTKRLLKHVEQADRRLETVLDISSAQKEPAKIKPKSRAKRVREGCPVILCSDWHVGETVDPDTVNGKNTYTPEIAEKRAHRLFKGAASTINVWESGYSIKEAIVWLGGDIITGYIHDELVESNSMSPTEEVLFARKLITQGINYILDNTGIEKLNVPCNYGNHGRLDKRKKVSTGAKNSFEWLLYKVLEQQYQDDKRVEFHVSNGSHLYMDVYGKTLRFHHGDDIKYWGGIGGLSTPMRKAVDGWNDFKHADITCIGHYHQCKDFGDSVINGSLIGFNAFALSIKARYEKAAQMMFLLDKKYGKRLITPIDVETD